MSDTPRTDEFARAECCDLQHALDFARKLEREIEDWKDKLDGSEITHEATRADLRDCKRELEQERRSPYIDSDESPVEVLAAIYDALDGITDDPANGYNFGTLVSRVKAAVQDAKHCEQERQDRKQADLDTIRALGERNDARKALEHHRQLVASLQALATTDHESKEAFIRRCRQTLGINEAVNPP